MELVLKSSPLTKSSAPPIDDLRFVIAAGDTDFSPGLTPAGVRGDEVLRVTGLLPGPVLLAGECRSWSAESKETQLDVTDGVRLCGPALVVGLSFFNLVGAGEGLPIFELHFSHFSVNEYKNKSKKNHSCTRFVL